MQELFRNGRSNGQSRQSKRSRSATSRSVTAEQTDTSCGTVTIAGGEPGPGPAPEPGDFDPSLVYFDPGSCWMTPDTVANGDSLEATVLAENDNDVTASVELQLSVAGWSVTETVEISPHSAEWKTVGGTFQSQAQPGDTFTAEVEVLSAQPA